jgi:hypothetical protein
MLKRTILASFAASFMLVGSFIPTAGEAVPPRPVLFRDDGRSTWQQLFKLVGPTCAKAAREGKRLRVTSCPLGGTGNRTAMVWALPRSPRPGSGSTSTTLHHNRGGGPGRHHDRADDPRQRGRVDRLPGRRHEVGRPVLRRADPPDDRLRPPHARAPAHFAYRFDPRGNNFIRLRGLKGSAGSYEPLGEAEIPMVTAEPTT